MTTTEAEVVKLLSSTHPRNWPTPFKERLAERLRQLSPKRVMVNKNTHYIRFEDETESQVTIVIEPKETNEAQ